MAQRASPKLNHRFSSVINSLSRENVSNTPDFILGDFIGAALQAMEQAVIARDRWYSIAPVPGQPTPPKPTFTELLGAVARGWCADKNRSKEMDSDLATAIACEVALEIGLPIPEQFHGEIHEPTTRRVAAGRAS